MLKGIWIWTIYHVMPHSLCTVPGSLECIRMDYFLGSKSQVELVRFFLGNAQDLKKIVLQSDHPVNLKKTPILPELLSLPSCQIIVWLIFKGKLVYFTLPAHWNSIFPVLSTEFQLDENDEELLTSYNQNIQNYAVDLGDRFIWWFVPLIYSIFDGFGWWLTISI